MMLTNEQVKNADRILSFIKKCNLIEDIYFKKIPEKDFLLAFLEDELKLIAVKKIRSDLSIPPQNGYRLTWNGFKAEKSGIEKYMADKLEKDNLEITKLTFAARNAKNARLLSITSIVISILLPFILYYIKENEYVDNDRQNDTNKGKCVCKPAIPVNSPDTIFMDGDTIAVIKW